MLTRRQDWAERLHTHIEAVRGKPFDWKTNNCAFFVCDCVQVMTDVDLAAPFRKLRRSQIQKAALTFEQIADLVAQEHEIKEIPVLMAQRGDVLLYPKQDNGQPALALVSLDGKHGIGSSDTGLSFLKLTDAIRAWRI